MSDNVGLVWLRRDLRLADNPALAEGAKRHDAVLVCFCFERGLTRGPHACPARNAYLLNSLTELEAAVRELGGRIVFRDGDAAEVIPELAKEIGASAVHVNKEHTVYGLARDRRVDGAVSGQGIAFVSHCGITCTEVGELKSAKGNPFRLFDPFYRAWREAPRRPLELVPQLLRTPDSLPSSKVPSEAQLAIDDEAKRIATGAAAGEKASRARLDGYMKRTNTYDEARDRPDLDWTSRLSAALHFGCVSARAFEERLTARRGSGRSELRRQLAWRDFMLHLTHHFPEGVRKGHERRLRDFRWSRDHVSLEAWKRGETGLPLVDAGMRQLIAEGWMHNRVRKIAAAFLSKHLLCDWRDGEAHFMRHLIDGDEASNNGNWQWAASVGADPLPELRAFNPVRHHNRFDPDGVYVRKWLPELAEFPDEYIAEPWRAPPEVQERSRCMIGEDYPAPIVDLIAAREYALDRFRSHLIHAG